MQGRNGRRREFHGGAWKLSYSDFTTAMLALFLLLWVLASTTPEQKRAIAAYARGGSVEDGVPWHPGGGSLVEGYSGRGVLKELIGGQIESIKRAASKNPDLERYLRNTLIQENRWGLDIVIFDLNGAPIFPLGSARMTEPARHFLKIIARNLVPLCAAGCRIEIDAHTDAYGFKNPLRSNWELSVDRAKEARKVMALGGLGVRDFSALVGYGDSKPAFEDPYDPRNRRIVIKVKCGGKE